jgi:hypothetical protein
MRAAYETNLTHLTRAAPAGWLRAGCVASLFVGLSACGGGDGGSQSATVTPTPAPAPAPNAPPPAPAPLVVGTAVSIDSGASGNPVGVRVARGANGDGFAVWQADDGTRHNLWANRYSGITAAWGKATNIEMSSADIDEFDLTVDANGNAVVVWHEAPADMVMSARFTASAGAWATPVQLATNASQPRVSGDASGAVLAVYSSGARGRFFDPVSGTWQPEAAIEQSTFSTGFSFGPVPSLDGNGNALVAFQNARTGVGILASNYFSRSTRSWGQLPPDTFEDILGAVPASFVSGFNDNLQLVASTGGNFVLIWQANFDDAGGNPASGSEIRVARFTSSVRTWSGAQTLIPGSVQKNVQLQRIASDAGGNLHLLWTESDRTRTVLKTVRLDQTGAACSLVEVIDRAIGGGAARADLAVDARGDAIAIWQQFEGGRPDDGSRSNIVLNHFDRTAGAWASAVLAGPQQGNAISPHASASGGQALLGWIQLEGGANRVKALLQPLANTGS